MRKIFTLSFIGFTSSLLIFSLATGVSHGSVTSGTLENKAQAVQWTGTIARDAAPTSDVPECAATPCDRFNRNPARSKFHRAQHLPASLSQRRRL